MSWEPGAGLWILLSLFVFRLVLRGSCSSSVHRGAAHRNNWPGKGASLLLAWMGKRPVACNPHMHLSGFSHSRVQIPMRCGTKRGLSQESHLQICCPVRLSPYQRLKNWHITMWFFFSFLLSCTLHLAQHNPPDKPPKPPWWLVWPSLDCVWGL